MSNNITHCVIAGQEKYHNTHHDNSSRICINARMTETGRQYFAEWRKFRGLTQAKAAELTGIQQGLLSALERGARRYNESHLEAMAVAYVCEIWELLGKNPDAPDTPSDIVNIWDHIPASNREQARQILKTFADQKKA